MEVASREITINTWSIVERKRFQLRAWSTRFHMLQWMRVFLLNLIAWNKCSTKDRVAKTYRLFKTQYPKALKNPTRKAWWKSCTTKECLKILQMCLTCIKIACYKLPKESWIMKGLQIRFLKQHQVQISKHLLSCSRVITRVLLSPKRQPAIARSRSAWSCTVTALHLAWVAHQSAIALTAPTKKEMRNARWPWTLSLRGIRMPSSPRFKRRAFTLRAATVKRVAASRSTVNATRAESCVPISALAKVARTVKTIWSRIVAERLSWIAMKRELSPWKI